MRRRRIRTSIATVFAMAVPLLALSPQPASAQEAFPLVCRGGGDMLMNFSLGAKEVTHRFRPGPGPAGQGLSPGQCSWVDRALRPGEPFKICQGGVTHFEMFWRDNPTGVIAQSNQVWYLGQMRIPNITVEINVYNDGNGCMRVA